MRPPIYEPTGKAKEYGDYALNIYKGCPHSCYYCFAPNVLHQAKMQFHSCAEPRPDIVDEVRKQLMRENITGKLIHLCFTCDPYPTRKDTTETREVIKELKKRGNHVQILTKGDGSRDFDLLDENDWYGVTISSMGELARQSEPGAVPPELRLWKLVEAHNRGIKTWVSFEPVLCERDIYTVLDVFHTWIDKVKIGKLNYHPSEINWKEFGLKVSAVCDAYHMDYYIKEGLRAEMEKR